MPNDTQIVSPATTPAPADYLVPGHAELLLKAVTATFRDNGAAGDWLPAVELLSDSGHTIALACDPNVKVTAGDDAKVSWFPGVKPGAAGGGGGVSTAYVSATLTNLDPHESIAAGNSNFIGYPHITISDPSVFSFTTSGPFTDSLLHVDKAGVVVMRSLVQWDNANFVRYSVFDTFNPYSASTSADSEFSTSDPFATGPWFAKDVGVGFAAAGSLIAVRAFNGGGVAHSVVTANLEVIWVG